MIAEPHAAPTKPRLGTVLLVDDDPIFLGGLAAQLEKQGIGVVRANSLESAKKALSSRAFDAAVVDLDLGEESGLDAIPVLCAQAGAAGVVAMSGHASLQSAVEAMRRGAFDFLEKPFSIDRLVEILTRALERSRLTRENTKLRSLLEARPQAPFVPPEKLGRTMQGVYGTASRAATLDVPVLITGETGTGKEYVARAIHAASPRASGPWFAVNCSAFQRDLVDSELFGHEKGAFTGAADMRLGLVEVARGGTLFLDEVGELPPEVQAKLLRVIDQGEFRRVGGTETLVADIRVVAATNRNLTEDVAGGRFRKDLLFRLNAVTIHIPPLRERREEVPVFVEAFLRARGRTDRTFPAPVMAALAIRDWPGNLRELRNEVDRLLLLGEPSAARVNQLSAPIGAGVAEAPAKVNEDEDLTVPTMERNLILRVLDLCGWNRRQASIRLGIDPRTLYRKIREYKLREPPK